MELVVIITLLCVVIWVFFCCLYIPYRDESRYIKAELKRSLGAERRYWQLLPFRAQEEAPFLFCVVAFRLCGFPLFLFIIIAGITAKHKPIIRRLTFNLDTTAPPRFITFAGRRCFYNMHIRRWILRDIKLPATDNSVAGFYITLKYKFLHFFCRKRRRHSLKQRKGQHC